MVTVVQVAFIVENTRICQLLDVVLLVDLCSSYIAIVPCSKRLVELDAVVLDAQIAICIRCLIVKIFVLNTSILRQSFF